MISASSTHFLLSTTSRSKMGNIAYPPPNVITPTFANVQNNDQYTDISSNRDDISSHLTTTCDVQQTCDNRPHHATSSNERAIEQCTSPPALYDLSTQRAMRLSMASAIHARCAVRGVCAQGRHARAHSPPPSKKTHKAIKKKPIVFDASRSIR